VCVVACALLRHSVVRVHVAWRYFVQYLLFVDVVGAVSLVVVLDGVVVFFGAASPTRQPQSADSDLQLSVRLCVSACVRF